MSRALAVFLAVAVLTAIQLVLPVTAAAPPHFQGPVGVETLKSMGWVLSGAIETADGGIVVVNGFMIPSAGITWYIELVDYDATQPPQTTFKRK